MLPYGEFGWSGVALAYQEQEREDDPRNTEDLKRHWVKNLCQKYEEADWSAGQEQ